MQNHFELFQLPVRFELDLTALSAAYREVQSRVHPDKFVQAGGAEQRVAMQWATQANEAYQVLKDPLKRAAYLCELHGVALNVESNTAMPRAFLLQQMEWREQLQEVRAGRDLAALEVLEAQLQDERRALLGRIGQLFAAGQFAPAAELVRCLMFVQRFGEEVAHTFELLET